MSLSSLLLKSTQNVDSELDALFKSQPPLPIAESPSKKRKLEEDKQQSQAKRPKSAKPDNKKGKAPRTKQEPSKQKIKPKKPEEEDDGENNSDLEAAYLREREDKKVETSAANESPVEEEHNEDEEGDSSRLIHESLTDKSKTKLKRGSKQKYTPQDESPAQREQRTIFVGNLSLEVAQKRPLQKQLQRHILSPIPTAKIESIRFRSIPFSAPTADLASTSDPSATTPKSDSKSKPGPHKNPSQREHDRSRASSWRHTNVGEDDTSAAKKDEQYLNPNQKKKIAFINQEFHSTADTVHAYIVFAHPIPQDSRPKNLPPLDPVMDPSEAAKEAVKKVDGTLFMERMIRVDFVGKKPGKGEKGGEAKEENGSLDTSFNDADPKLTLFVGNLDLASKEEDLRVFFESVMKTERGEPPVSEDQVQDEDGEDAVKKPKTWVTTVRIIRDKDTQLGKGFGYVQFIDRECVDEILTMEPSQLKFAKRKLRVQRCKTIPGTKLPSSVKLSTNTNHANSKSKSDRDEKTKTRPSQAHPPVPIIVPKGDPTLGTKLANLSKEQRKKAKASDADRVARRLAKKKARMAMNTSKDRAAEDGLGASVPEKRRERVRKGAAGVLGKKSDVKRKKGRVRSEKSLEKRNAKK